MQLACGENNAFTNNDYTDFYITLPKDNIETALWLESDRMTGLTLTRETMETEKRVVIEEFRQRYLNQPYGDQLLLLRELAYTRHPYRWATIGRTPEHVERATEEEVTDFYRRYYRPSNAILTLSADLEEERMIELCEKWFGDLPDDGTFRRDPLPAEPEQTAARRLTVERPVPATSLTVAYPMGPRLSPDFFAGDLVSDLLAGGESARLYDELVRRRQTLLVGQCLHHRERRRRPLSSSRASCWRDGRRDGRGSAAGGNRTALRPGPNHPYELEKVKNKFEANTLFGELNVMNKAMNLGFYEMLGDLPLINREVEIYRSVTAETAADFCRRTFRPEKVPP